MCGGGGDLLLASYITKLGALCCIKLIVLPLEHLLIFSDPYNIYNINCVELLIAGRKLGHLCKEAACIVAPSAKACPLKLLFTVDHFPELVSRSWHFCMCDLLIQITGAKESVSAVSSALSGRHTVDHTPS